MRKQNYRERIATSPKVMVGKPVIKGTRITVELIMRLLVQGQTPGEILKAYPHLKRDDIFAAIAYATELVEEESVYPLSESVHGKAKTLAG